MQQNILWRATTNDHAKSITNSGITTSNNDMKDIIKVIKSLEDRGTLLKETTEKVIYKKRIP